MRWRCQLTRRPLGRGVMRVIVYGFNNLGGYGALLNVDQATGAPISERKRRLLYDAITYVFHWSYTNDAWDRRMEELSDDGATSDDGQELDFDFLVGDTREVKVWPFLIKGYVNTIARPCTGSTAGSGST